MNLRLVTFLMAVQKIRNAEGWVGVVIFVTMRYEKYGGWRESECGALRNANEKLKTH